MLKNYLTVTLRTLRRHPAYTFINVTGLAVGMACCLLILLFVRDELSYDRFHTHADRIYRIVSDWGDFSVPATNPPTVVGLTTDYPEIEVARLMPWNSGLVRYEDQQFREEGILLANPTAFDVFTIPLRRGDPHDLLEEPFTVVLSAPAARKYFGDANPIGKTLVIDNEYDFEITGIAEPLPENSHFHFDFLVSFNTINAFFDYENSMSWGSNNTYTYLLLPEGMAPEALEAQFPDFIERHAGEDWNGATLSLQPLTDIHLHSHHNSELEPNSDVAYVYVFSIIAALILLVACVNFMNLATARAAERAKEVGVRKVVGAERGQLIRQFLAESTLLASVALVLAVALTAAALPAFRALSGKSVTLGTLFGDPFVPAAFLAVTLLVGLVAGSYPAFVLSAFRPVTVLKGTLRTGTHGTWLRKGLVVFQFATSVCLIAGTLVVYSQLDYLRSARLGFDKEQVLAVPSPDPGVTAQFSAFKDALSQQPAVAEVSIASEGLPSELLNGSGFTMEGSGMTVDEASQQGWGARNVAVGHGFFETLGVEMAAGRPFSLDYPSDSTAFILNEAAVRLIAGQMPALGTPEALIGKHLTLGYRGITGPVVGVTRDFNLSSLHEAVEPIVFFIHPGWYDTFLIRVRPQDYAATVEAVQATWERLFPEWPFEYQFADQGFDAQYRAEQRLGSIFTTFSLLALFIACLGLFGLASFTAQQRTKEIGVRKVLGASVPGIIALLSKDFARLVGLAFVIAVPVAYLAMDRWLDAFAYRIDIAWWVFLLAGLLTLAIALLTVSYQSVRAALTDPVESLRYE